jgi:hypothetical protein
MRDLRPALRKHLLDDPAISATVGQRIYPMVLPQGIVSSSIVYTRISGIGDHTYQGPSGLNQPRYQIDAWAATIDGAFSLADAIKERLDGFRGTVNYGADPVQSVVIQGAFFADEREDYDAGSKLYRVSRDYMIWFEERGDIILNLPTIPWEGGSAYWAQFPKAQAAGWSDPTFFPIAVFLGKSDNGHPALYAALGINTYMAAEHQVPISQVTDYLFAITQDPESHTGEWTQAEIGNDPKVVGWFMHDECEMGMGACATPPAGPGTEEDRRLAMWQGWCADVRAYNDGRFIWTNFGNGVRHTFWSPNTFHQFIAAIDGCAADQYVYTHPTIIDGFAISPDWPVGAPANKCAAAYGWIADQLAMFNGLNATRRPYWLTIETKLPMLTDNGRVIILYDQIAGAVWAGIIHEARGICYFDQNAFYDNITFPGGPTIDPNTGLAPDEGLRSLIDCEQGLKDAVAAINAEVTSLASVLNTQSYVWDTGAVGIDTMTKVHEGHCYIFAIPGLGATLGSKTFTLPPNVSGTTAVVIGEARFLSVTDGEFVDAFLAEHQHHVYRIEI